MAIRTNPELAAILAAEQTQYSQARALDNALTGNKRIKAKHNSDVVPQSQVWTVGTLFRDAALGGNFVFQNAEIINYGTTYDLTTCTSADLATGIAVVRIEGNGHWIEGTLGLAGSGTDFTLPTNPTSTNSIALSGTFRIKPNQSLPDGTPDTTAPTVTITSATNNVTTSTPFKITAAPTDASGISKVEFYSSGRLLGTKTQAPWELDVNPSYFDNGTRYFYAKAYDTIGNVGESAAQGVTTTLAYPLPTGSVVAIGNSLTNIVLENTSASLLSNTPVTFAQVFKFAALPSASANVELRAPDNSAVPCQIDVKDVYSDGSVKHAVISAIIPSIAASATASYNIVRKSAGNTPTPTTPADYSALEAVVTFVEAGTTYSISLATLMAGTKTDWLSGDVVSEWEYSGIPKTSGNVEHTHLHVRFCVRAYKGQNKARVDITVENTWAMGAEKQFTYDVTMTVGGNNVFSKTALLHYASARYRNVFWWNATEPPVNLKHNIDYLIATKAVPNYDKTVVPSLTTATSFKNNTITNGGPFGRGTAFAYMPNTGGRPDIGILPAWAALYILSMNVDAKTAVLNQGNQAGSWGIHRRDKNTGKVISFNEYPNYPSGKPADITTSTNPNVADRAHHPDQAFVPYLVTGDLYYLEELQFWAMYCAWGQNSVKREGNKGIWRGDQVRAQGWCFRTMAHAAWITPPGTRKTEFNYILQSNLTWYNTRYTNSSALDARLGAVVHNLNDDDIGSPAYGGRNAISIFMDDHFTSAVGRVAELGFNEALPLLDWKARYQVGRLYGVPGVCWIQAAMYNHAVRRTGYGTPTYSSLKKVYEESVSPDVLAEAAKGNCATQAMADAWKAAAAPSTGWIQVNIGMTVDGVANPIVGDMDGYSDQPDGYPSNLQQAIAQIASYPIFNANHAWEVFEGRTVKPSYNSFPQFAIVPRT